MIVLQIKPFEIVCKHSSEQLQAAVALSRQALQLVRSQYRVNRLPLWVLVTVADVPWGIMTKTMANACQPVKVLHSRRGRLVALGGCVRAAISPFYRKRCDIPMANKTSNRAESSSDEAKFVFTPRLLATVLLKQNQHTHPHRHR